MDTLAVSPSFLNRLQKAFSNWVKPAVVRPVSEVDAQDVRNRMAFMMDMMEINSDAFATDNDVQSMMRLYRDRF